MSRNSALLGAMQCHELAAERWTGIGVGKLPRESRGWAKAMLVKWECDA